MPCSDDVHETKRHCYPTLVLHACEQPRSHTNTCDACAQLRSTSTLSSHLAPHLLLLVHRRQRHLDARHLVRELAVEGELVLLGHALHLGAALGQHLVLAQRQGGQAPGGREVEEASQFVCTCQADSAAWLPASPAWVWPRVCLPRYRHTYSNVTGTP